MEKALQISNVKWKETGSPMDGWSVWRMVKQIWSLLSWSCWFMGQFWNNGYPETANLERTYLVGFFSIRCCTDFLVSVWYDHHYLKWRQSLILTHMKFIFPVETEKHYELAEGESTGLDSWEWHCRELILKVHCYALADVNICLFFV